MIKFYTCNDNNPKIIRVEFDTGSLQKKDVWALCEQCNQKSEFQMYRLYAKKLGNLKN